jgi:hypothetical protein
MMNVSAPDGFAKPRLKALELCAKVGDGMKG